MSMHAYTTNRACDDAFGGGTKDVSLFLTKSEQSPASGRSEVGPINVSDSMFLPCQIGRVRREANQRVGLKP